MRLPACSSCVLMVPAAFAARPGGRGPTTSPTATASPATPTRRAPGPNRSAAMRCSRRRRRPCSATSVRPARRVRFGEGAAAARFFRRGGGFMVAAQGPTAARRRSRPAVFGIRPLRRCCCRSRADACRPSRSPGIPRKAWFSLHADGPVAPGDNLHWSGRYQNWNLMCGGATTATAGATTTSTTATPPPGPRANVGCQACHGAGRAPRRERTQGRRRGRGAARRHCIPRTGRWPGARQVDQCAACRAPHPAGRGRGGRRAAVRPVRPRQPAPGLYHADGQRLDEVFGTAPYRQSRMYQTGVAACTDCRPSPTVACAPTATLCLACHNPAPTTAAASPTCRRRF